MNKNDGTCFDNYGLEKFSCSCRAKFHGERCEFNRCDSYECQNSGNCTVDVINDILTPRCRCPINYSGPTCHLYVCDDNVPCYNHGTCAWSPQLMRQTCQCSQEDGIDKYFGISCDMPAACDGNPCQNGGTCTSIIQATSDVQVFDNA